MMGCILAGIGVFVCAMGWIAGFEVMSFLTGIPIVIIGVQLARNRI